MRILIVDDDYINRTKLKVILTAYGDCDAVPNGEMAVEIFTEAHRENFPYELISIDIGLPGIQGTEVLARMRQWEDAQGIAVGDGAKIVMVTSSDEPTDVKDSFREGCESYVKKPATRESMASALNLMGVAPE
jgi:two-component system, chemotaxis family, chemotaxis protein CheY